MFGMGLPNNTHKRHASEIITSVILKQNNQTDLKDCLKNFNNKLNENQKELFFDSFSEVKDKNIITDNTNLNSADNSMMELNNKDILENFYTNRYTNKSMVNSIINRFHDLYMKLIGKYKKLKIENNNLKKNLKTANSTNSPNQNINDFINKNSFSNDNETDTIKYLINEELECFNQILFDFNIQFNDLQSQDEILRRHITKKQKEIENINIEIEEYKKQKDFYFKEIKNYSTKLNDFEKNPLNNEINKNLKFESNIESLKSFKENCNYSFNLYVNNTNKSKNSINSINDIETKEENILIENSQPEEIENFFNSDNKEYFLKKILNENKNYKDLLMSTKADENEISNYIYQLETELENFGKFKNFFLSKITHSEENLILCKKSIDEFNNKINTLEIDLEFSEFYKKKKSNQKNKI